MGNIFCCFKQKKNIQIIKKYKIYVYGDKNDLQYSIIQYDKENVPNIKSLYDKVINILFKNVKNNIYSDKIIIDDSQFDIRYSVK
jgi:hypothetical protein